MEEQLNNAECLDHVIMAVEQYLKTDGYHLTSLEKARILDFMDDIFRLVKH